MGKSAKTIAIANRKGGVGKTQTTVNLGAGLARQGKRVLCVDTDSQHSLTVSLGVTEPEKLTSTLATAMLHIVNEQSFDPTAGIIRHSEGVDLLPANNALGQKTTDTARWTVRVLSVSCAAAVLYGKTGARETLWTVGRCRMRSIRIKTIQARSSRGINFVNTA